MTTRIECVLHGYCAFDFTALWSSSSSLVLIDLLYCPSLMHIVLKVEWLYMAAYEGTATLCSGPTALLLSRVLHLLPHISHTHTLIITISWFLSFRHYLWTTMEKQDWCLSQLLTHSTHTDRHRHFPFPSSSIVMRPVCSVYLIMCM